MAAFYDVNTVSNSIHNLVQSSGLHFVINQTPWSSYITIRRKFLGPAPAAQPTLPRLGVSEQNEKLKHQIIALENALVNADEETKIAELKSKQVVENLHLKIDNLENSLVEAQFELKKKEEDIAAVEKEKIVKDEIIENLNDGFNKKIADLKVKVKDLEKTRKEAVKKEKKAMKKKKQKARKDQEQRGAELHAKADVTNNNATAEDDFNTL